MRFAPLAPAALLTALTMSCSDSTAPAIQLTDQEVALLFQELSSATGTIPAVASSAATAPGLAALTTTSVSTTVECVGGGTVSLSGTVREDDPVTTLDVTERFTNCVSEHFTVNGLVRLTATISLPNDSTMSLQAALRGTIDAAHVDGRSGSCPVNVTLSLSSAGNSFTANASGTVCGRDAEAVVSVSS